MLFSKYLINSKPINLLATPYHIECPLPHHHLAYILHSATPLHPSLVTGFATFGPGLGHIGGLDKCALEFVLPVLLVAVVDAMPEFSHLSHDVIRVSVDIFFPIKNLS